MKEVFYELLTFIYGIAHIIGIGIAKVIGFIFPQVELPLNIIDAIGFLSVLTVFLILVQAAKKIAWIIVIIGWILILVRIIMVILNLG